MPSLDDDYLQRAREYWQEYQFYVYIGLAMLLAAITGFTFSHSYSEQSRVEANTYLYELMDSADAGEREAAEVAYAALEQAEGYEELKYLGAFVLSSLYATEGDTAAVTTVLTPVLNDSGDAAMRQLAALRIAEGHITADEPAAALEVLREHQPDEGRLRVLFAERIGDAEYIAGNLYKATRSYREAIELTQDSSEFYRPLLAIKQAALLSTTEAVQAIKAEEEELREALQAALEENAAGAEALAEEALGEAPAEEALTAETEETVEEERAATDAQ